MKKKLIMLATFMFVAMAGCGQIEEATTFVQNNEENQTTTRINTPTETDAIGIKHINNLLQLRIVGENQFYVAADSKKISIEKLFGLLEETKLCLKTMLTI